MNMRMMFSKTAITVESAANDMNRKKSAPQSCPSHICEKTLGKVTNTRPGPLPGSTPKAKQTGKMMRPAMSAMTVSSTPTESACPKMRRSLPR